MSSITRRSFISFAFGSAALASLALAGCDNSDDDTTSSSSSSPDSENTVTSDPGIQSIKDRGTLKCGIKTDVPGFGYDDPNTGTYDGLEVDLCYQIAGKIFGITADEAKSGDKVSFTGVTAKTRGPLLDSGELDLVAATYTITEERKQSWNFSDPYYTDSLGMLVLKSSGMKTLDDLDGKIIGVAQGATTKDAVQQMLQDQGKSSLNVTFQEFPDYPTLSAALSSQTIDVFSVDRSILHGYEDDSNELLCPDIIFGEQQYGVATNLNATELTDLVNGVIDDLKSSGELDELIAANGLDA
ncbi:MAG: transporter substrate-binding domain-containing protein [Atopobiaceae bacterium]|jgi:putative glutamine transport system substrate-binding protein|nr:transporter substrate-binding domain-containing protein [Atopobiaceae bacterium]